MTQQFVPYIKPLLLLLLLVSIIHQCTEEYINTGYIGDKSVQIGAAHSWLGGYGLTTCVADPNDLARVARVPLSGWPPGYSFLMAFFMRVFGDVFWASLAIDFIAITLFFIAWFYILQWLSGEAFGVAQLIIWPYWAFIHNPLMATSGSTDKLSLALFSTGLAACLWVVVNRRNHLVVGLLSGAAVGASVIVRYSYRPLLLVFPLALFLCAVKIDRRLARTALANLAVAVFITISGWLYQRSIDAPSSFLSTYYPQETLGYYWDHLLRFFPFPVSSVMLLPAIDYFAQLLHVPSFIKNLYLWLTAMAILLIFAALAYRHASELLKPPSVEKEQAASSFFYLSGIITLILVVSMLAYLTIRTPYQTIEGSAWTFVEENRYYAPLYGFLTVSLITFLLRWKTMWPQGWARVLSLLFIASLSIPVFATGTRRAAGWWMTLTGKRQNQQALYRPRQFTAATLMQTIAPLVKDKNTVVYIDDSNPRLYLATLSGACTYDTKIKLNAKFTASAPTHALVALSRGGNQERSAELKELVALHHGRKIAEMKDADLFELEIAPVQK